MLLVAVRTLLQSLQVEASLSRLVQAQLSDKETLQRKQVFSHVEV